MTASPRLYWDYLVRQLRYGWVRAFALGLGVTVALGGSLVLAAATSASTLQIRGTVEDTPRSAYDILVRPRGAAEPTETRDDLVRPNFLGGQYGGITLDQWRRVRAVPGVEVAAPVANVGFALPYTSTFVPMSSIPHQPGDLIRLSLSWEATNGTAIYPGSRPLVFFAASPADCDDLQFSPPPTVSGPFDVEGPANVYLTCVPPDEAASGGVEIDVIFPLLIAGIDPEQESRLTGLDTTVVEGRMLKPADVAISTRFGPSVPVIASSRTFVDQTLTVTPEKLTPPDEQPAAALLRQSDSYMIIDGLDGPGLTATEFLPADLYAQVLTDLEHSSNASESFSAYWQVGDVTYERRADGSLVPVQVESDPDVLWRDGQGFGGYAPVPPANQDIAFRELTKHASIPRKLGVGSGEVNLLGRFDPELLPGFDPRSEVPLETYVPPRADPADPATNEILDNEPYLPTFNLAGYLNQPPHLLTTIDGARALLSARNFVDVGAAQKAPISAIRVRVGEVTGNDRASLDRIQSAAALIAERTGLMVDVTAGSSPQPQLVQLPAGAFGTPALLLSEPWVKKGVALAIVDALDRKTAGLLGLTIGIAVVFLASAGLATVRSRRTELATLRCLGWSPRHVFLVVIGEVVLVGTAGGILAAAVAWAGSTAFGSPANLWVVIALPLAGIAITSIAGTLPAVRAARMDPLEHLSPPAIANRARHRIRGVLGVAVTDLIRVPGRNLIASAILALGVGALAVLTAITLAFRGTVTGTLLGDYVVVEVRPADYVAAGMVLVFAGLVLADILVLTMRERAPELATLRVIGWHDRHLSRLVGYGGAAVGLTGSLLGAAAGCAVALWIGGAPGPSLMAAGLAAAAGLVVTLAASAIPALAVARTPIAVVAAEI